MTQPLAANLATTSVRRVGMPRFGLEEPALEPPRKEPGPGRRATGIIATLGPSTDSPDAIRKLAEAGVNVFRLNFSHGQQAEHAQRIRWIKDTSAVLLAKGAISRPLQVFADIQGPKIRVGKLNGQKDPGLDNRPYFPLVTGQLIYLSKAEESDNPNVIPVTFPGLIDALKPGQTLLMDDGKIELRVMKAATKGGKVACGVVRNGDGKLYSNKGINLPDVPLDIPALTEKDRDDIAFALANGVDGVAISFVRTPQDMAEARALVKDINPDAVVISKIEKPDAVQPGNLRGIVKLSDWVMVARGDLGIETDPVEVPELQEQIINEARRQGKKAIVATQMLESMLNSRMPSRADVSDIADAVKDGTDFVMLSGETAVGRYPVETVEQMARIVTRYEAKRGIRYQLKLLWLRLTYFISELLHALGQQTAPSVAS